MICNIDRDNLNLIGFLTIVIASHILLTNLVDDLINLIDKIN